MTDFTATRKIFDRFGQNVIIKARANLSARSKNGPLSKSLRYQYKQMKNSFVFNLYANSYAKFHDQGVKGTGSNVARNKYGSYTWEPPANRPRQAQGKKSPFSFVTGPGKNTILKSMVDKPSFRTRDLETGQFTPKTTENKNQAAYLIARSIGRYGTPTTLFLTRPIETFGKKLIRDLSTAFVKDQRKFVDKLKAAYTK